MYRVEAINPNLSGRAMILHSGLNEGAKLLNAPLTEKLEGIDEFEFTMGLNHPHYNDISDLITVIKIYSEQTNKLIFSGRVLYGKDSMDSDGAIKRVVLCESKLAYLLDSNQRYKEVHNTTVADFFSMLIEVHNRTVEPHKRFIVGRVTVTNSTDNVYRFVDYTSTLETIKEKLISRLGGYLQIREEPKGTYIDYLAEVGETSDTILKLGDNIKGTTKEINAVDVVTRVFPLGSIIESEDNRQERVTIASVNKGQDYIDSPDLQAVYGIIEDAVFWDDVTLPQNLKTKAEDFLKNQTKRNYWEVNAVDLSLLSNNYERFEIGNHYVIDNPLIDTERTTIQLFQKKTDLLQPQNPALTFGEKKTKISTQQLNATLLKKEILDINALVNYNNYKTTLVSNKIVLIDQEINQIKIDLEKGDTENIQKSLERIQKQINESIESQDEVNRAQRIANDKQALLNIRIDERLKKLESKG